MVQVTKIFRFETAHAIFGYDGPCKNIHGHSYELHVTITGIKDRQLPIPGPGFVIDFKALKQLVNQCVVQQLDHQLLLSEDYLQVHPALSGIENLRIWKMEPSAENLLYFIKEALQPCLPDTVQLYRLKIYETADSYAEWENKDLI